MIFNTSTSTIHYDDDVSISSTLTCDDLPKKDAISSRSGPLSPRVHFDESSNVSYDNSEICKEDCCQMWYTAVEYKEFKKARISSVRKIMRSTRYGEVIEHTYGVCCNFSEDVESIILTNEESKDLRQVYRAKSGHFIGLERVAVRDVALDRCSRRSEILDMVLDMQHDDGLYNFPDADSKAEVIRQFSERLSGPSKLFAMHIAIAQASLKILC
jgi:hypothetical protein